ncbi:hypothetical protein BDV96DRAFT_481227 [Lophiotrema nucula]|uniref:DSC E3 ubiquitin ligase complex subunit A n=1 Tax=Lophiotrema nucula TaxID=690887 RepID=A0A6A5ZX24_9PLEO|nr:hypothetical protein BDV96DRAFT_481227 [Lophiotrema nucula]
MSSQQYDNAHPAPGGSSSEHRDGDDAFIPHAARPGYMTVGSGSTPEAAARLVSMLDDDSGYGGSIVDGDIANPRWRQSILEDRPTPPPTPIFNGGADHTEQDRQRSHIIQLRYNQNKNALGRAIHGTIDTLRSFQDMNLKWPATYPSVVTPEPKSPTNKRLDFRPHLQHTQSSLADFETRSPPRPQAPRRAGTSIGDEIAEPSSSAAPEKKQEPRLVTPQLAHDYSVLKLELRMGGRTQTDLVHSLEKNSVASLLDGQIQQSIRHLQSIKERIEDTSSKVLVTGDLNAGKSTFCNALLRRKVLPEDQQPCTSIFCEVLDFRENSSVEEVHAVPIGSVYNRNDESTYTVFELKDLEKLVVDDRHFSQCKVYIKDIRSVDESLLNNGVVDIALIDAPGLNMDSLQTTAVFARQEEIDVVVFVVSAANHFTQSAKDFIFNAAREKAYIFMVVNGYDNIRDKQRCQEMILKQVAHLSPATFKESSDLVHFVSSTAIPTSNSPDGDDGDDDPSDKGKGKEEEKRDFDGLERSLRQFVLEKRAKSKLAPAKTYLLNVLGDVNNLASVNRDVAQSELDRVKKEMDALEPEYEESKKARTEAGETVDRMVEETTSDAYNYTRETLDETITKVGDQDLGVPYPGLLSAYQYAEDLRDSMLHEISESVRLCEEHARTQAVQSFNGIKNLGVLHLGNKLYADVMFRPDKMFRKPVHALARQVDIDIDLWDFFDIGNLWERQEKVAGTSMAVTVAGVVGGRLVGGAGWLDGALGAAKIMGTSNLRRLIIPGLIAGVAIGVSYILSSVPRTLPHRLSAKLSTQLAAIDYTHTNATRISSEIRRALKGPANDVRIGLQRNVEKLQQKKEETTKFKVEAEVARKYFGNLVRSSNDLRQGVMRVDLDPPVVPVYSPMEARRDPRSFLFFIILLLLINSPEPQSQQAAFGTHSRYDDIIAREYTHLDLLNRTHYGDFSAKNDRWLNMSGLRDEDGFAWELLPKVQAKAREKTLVWMEQKDLEGRLEGDVDIPVYRNVSGHVEGEWVRSPLSVIRHPSDMLNMSQFGPQGPFPVPEYDRNLTGQTGSVRLHIQEREGSVRTDENGTVSEVGARLVIGDKGSWGGNWWEFVLHGVHYLEFGGMVLTTTSDRFAGVFALPHLQLSQYLYETSQSLLNATLNEDIERQLSRAFPVWNPWTSAVDGANEGVLASPHCEYVIYLQQHPLTFNSDAQNFAPEGQRAIDWLEEELRYPTGSPLPRRSPLSFSMVGFSPDCGFVFESKGPPDYPPSSSHLSGAKTEEYDVKAKDGIIAFAVTLSVQLIFLVKQMKEAATPSTRNRISFYTIKMLALGDGFAFLSLIFMHLFLGASQLLLYATAFLSLFSVVFELRFLMDIWSVQATEQMRQEREQAASAPPATPATAPATAAPNTPAPTATPPTDGGLPLPATAPRAPRPPTPIIIAPDQDDPSEDITTPTPAGQTTTATPTTTTTAPSARTEIGALYSRYCLLLIGIFFITLQFTTMRTSIRAFYFNTLCFAYLSFWTPQIYRNIMRNCRKALRWDFVLGQSFVRLIPISYFYLVQDNVLFSRTDGRALMVLAGWVWIQILALASQEVLGSRFFVREGWAPPAYDYHPLLREDEEGATMPIGSTNPVVDDDEASPSSPTSASTTRKAGETKSKGKKVFDCSICTQDIEVPVIPNGGSGDGLSGGLVFERRAYMVTPCRHIFHTACLEGWMRYRLQCPNCREILPPL